MPPLDLALGLRRFLPPFLCQIQASRGPLSFDRKRCVLDPRIKKVYICVAEAAPRRATSPRAGQAQPLSDTGAPREALRERGGRYCLPPPGIHAHRALPARPSAVSRPWGIRELCGEGSQSRVKNRRVNAKVSGPGGFFLPCEWLRGPAVQQRIRLKLGRARQHVGRVRPASAHPRGERERGGGGGGGRGGGGAPSHRCSSHACAAWSFFSLPGARGSQDTRQTSLHLQRSAASSTSRNPEPARPKDCKKPEVAARASCTAKDQVETREGPPARRESETRERAPTRREERGGGGGGGGGGGEGGPRVDPWIVCPAVQRSERPRGKSCAGPRRVRPASGSISTLGRLTACTSVARARRTSLRSCLRKLPLPHGHIRSGACSQSSTRSRSAGRLLRVADAGSHLGLEVASAPS
ncbi:unnamed protein product [Prorocentrum cordatum]|uniref:Uncharacterized protein n=1 Tax=Prorocentrum cordatum TaxID=2364126 RepID=A0ABN9TGH1_9DINO|nr:unnamed protein product [Polarella glacialis]